MQGIPVLIKLLKGNDPVIQQDCYGVIKKSCAER
jgi:hypothetical protein